MGNPFFPVARWPLTNPDRPCTLKTLLKRFRVVILVIMNWTARARAHGHSTTFHHDHDRALPSTALPRAIVDEEYSCGYTQGQMRIATPAIRLACVTAARTRFMLPMIILCTKFSIIQRRCWRGGRTQRPGSVYTQTSDAARRLAVIWSSFRK